MDSSKNINLTQLAEWLASATRNNADFLIKPADLRLLYTLVLWEYISTKDRTLKITKNSQIEIPEEELVRLIKLVFTPEHYQYFTNINQM